MSNELRRLQYTIAGSCNSILFHELYHLLILLLYIMVVVVNIRPRLDAFADRLGGISGHDGEGCYVLG